MVALAKVAARPVDSTDFLWNHWAARKPLHVLDVGANPVEGDAPYKELLARGYCDVTGFEPQPDALAALNEKKSAAETYLPDALGTGEAATLYRYTGSGFGSLFRIKRSAAALLGLHRDTRIVGEDKIQTRRMDEIADVPQVDFLKIDVQGSEMAIIANGAKKLGDAVAVQTEVRLLPLYEGEPSFGQLDDELRAQGFMFHDFSFLKRMSLNTPSKSALKRRALRQVVDGDAFYIKDLTNEAALSSDQLFRLAILADGVMKSYSLALFCVDTLARRGDLAVEAVAEYRALIPAELKR